MGRNLIQLPVEIIQQIGENVLHRDRCKLSSTCSLFSNILEPFVFRAVRIENRAQDAKAIRSVLQKYGKHIRRLSFHGTASILIYDEGYDESEEDQNRLRAIESVKNEPFPDDVLLQLADASTLLPVLEEISINFNCNVVPEDSWDNFWEAYAFTYPGYSNIQSLYTLFLPFYKTISSLRNISVLTIHDLFPGDIDVWATEEMIEFLHPLKKVELCMYGNGHQPDYSDPYVELCEAVGERLLRNLTSTTTFSLGTSRRYNYLGGVETQVFPTSPPLKPGYMSALRNLELVSYFIGIKGEVRNFLVAHSGVLEKVVLHNCHAIHVGPDWTDGKWLGWEDLFDSLANTDPVLSTFEIKNDTLPLWDSAQAWQHDSGNPSTMTRAQTSRRRRYFSYRYVSEDGNKLAQDKNFRESRFEEGGDQRAYDNLMDIVEINALRKKLSREAVYKHT
ncbi:hypothetical protein BT63DRAFT_63417 [Microthyrium microscopicum]|uniref:F-box domain-containing protein n=1 Tax=Microthyrium microscopicum TaxID=703497 RepID=A0A6A6U289_9PEZI|nr:hypothetical protein BT63DRAFT_63417 [Microthyrium microscopicum]